MASPNEKLANSLEVLRELQETGIKAIKTSKISRVHRDRLVKNGYLKQVTKGWYITSRPEERQGETASWYTSYWDFCAEYLSDMYPDDDYFISPDQSILVHIGSETIPIQLIVRTNKQMNHKTPLIHNTSIWHWESPSPKAAEFIKINGIRMMTLTSSLVYSGAGMFISNPTDMRAALAMIGDSSEVLRVLLEGGNTLIAGRLAGAFRNIGKDRIADDIIKAMRAADFDVRESEPFKQKTPLTLSIR